MIGLAIGSFVSPPRDPLLRGDPCVLPRPAGRAAQADRLGRLAALQRRGAARAVDQDVPISPAGSRPGSSSWASRRSPCGATAPGRGAWSHPPLGLVVIKIVVLAAIVLGVTALLSANRGPTPTLHHRGDPVGAAGRGRAAALLDVHPHQDPLRPAPLRRRRQRRGRPPRRHQRAPDPHHGLRHLLVDGRDQRLLLASDVGKVSPGSGGGTRRSTPSARQSSAAPASSVAAAGRSTPSSVAW